MELKDVTRETKIEECDFFSRITKGECIFHDVETIGQLLEVPVEKIEKWHGWKAKNEIKLFIAEYKNENDPYRIETRVMFGRTFVKVYSELGLGDTAIDPFHDFWYDAEDIKCVYQIHCMGSWHLVFDTKNSVPAKTYILKAYIDEKN